MKVIVLGSGVIGVSCAYQLAEAGHEVTRWFLRSETDLWVLVGPGRWRVSRVARAA